MFLFHLFRSFLPLHNPIGFGAADSVELALALLLAGLALAWRAGIERLAARLARRTGWCLLLLVGLPVALRLLLLPAAPVPAPAGPDDFSHLLVGGTVRPVLLDAPGLDHAGMGPVGRPARGVPVRAADVLDEHLLGRRGFGRGGMPGMRRAAPATHRRRQAERRLAGPGSGTPVAHPSVRVRAPGAIRGAVFPAGAAAPIGGAPPGEALACGRAGRHAGRRHHTHP